MNRLLTPASTLVISKTLIPANGNFSTNCLPTLAFAVIPRVHARGSTRPFGHPNFWCDAAREMGRNEFMLRL
jgi:hypothetical protein